MGDAGESGGRRLRLQLLGGGGGSREREAGTGGALGRAAAGDGNGRQGIPAQAAGDDGMLERGQMAAGLRRRPALRRSGPVRGRGLFYGRLARLLPRHEVTGSQAWRAVIRLTESRGLHPRSRMIPHKPCIDISKARSRMWF